MSLLCTCVLYRTLVFLQICGAFCITRSIDQDSFPFLVDLNTQKTYNWGTGRVAEYLSSGPAVRISSRGVRFVHPSQALVRQSFGDSVCLRAPSALCNLAGTTTRVFPENGASVAFRQSNSLCSEEHSGRTVVFEGSSDVTLCDITSGDQYMILTASGEYMQRESRLGHRAYLFISVLQVALVAYVVHRLAVGGQSQAWGALSSVFGAMLCFVACVLVLATHQSHGLYVTQQDFYALVVLLSYVFFHLGRWVYYTLRYGHRAPCYGMLIGALNILFFRSFATLDNPCVIISLVFIMARFAGKLTRQTLRESVLRVADSIFDSVMIGVLAVYGVVPQYECAVHAWTHLLLLTCGVFAFVQEYDDCIVSER